MFDKLANSGGIAPVSLVAFQVQDLKLTQFTQFCRDGIVPRKVIAGCVLDE